MCKAAAAKRTLTICILPVPIPCLPQQHKQQLGSKDLDCFRGLVDQQQPFKGFPGAPNQCNSNSSKQEQFFPLVGSQQQHQQLLLVQSVSAVRSSKADDIELCFSDDGLGIASPKINLVAASDDSTPPNSSISGLNISGDTGASDTGASASAFTYWYHVWVLMVRFSKSWVRTPIMAIAEAVQYVILSLFLGLLYLRSPLALPNAPFDRMGAMFVVLTMLSLTPSYTVLVMWDHERQLLRRETSTNMYKRYAGLLQLVPTSALCSASRTYHCDTALQTCSASLPVNHHNVHLPFAYGLPTMFWPKP